MEIKDRDLEELFQMERSIRSRVFHPIQENIQIVINNNQSINIKRYVISFQKDSCISLTPIENICWGIKRRLWVIE